MIQDFVGKLGVASIDSCCGRIHTLIKACKTIAVEFEFVEVLEALVASPNCEGSDLESKLGLKTGKTLGTGNFLA